LTFQQSVRLTEMTLCQTQGGNLHNVITDNVIWANQRTELFVYRWLRALAMSEVTHFPAFVGVSDIMTSALSMRLLSKR